MPSRRHKTAMLSSPRRPDTTIRIFSSAENCLRVLRRISRTVLSAGSLLLIDFRLIFVPFGQHDGPEILRYEITSICPKGADADTRAPWLRPFAPPFFRCRHLSPLFQRPHQCIAPSAPGHVAICWADLDGKTAPSLALSGGDCRAGTDEGIHGKIDRRSTPKAYEAPELFDDGDRPRPHPFMGVAL